MLDLECALGYKLIYTFKNINLQEKKWITIMKGSKNYETLMVNNVRD